MKKFGEICLKSTLKFRNFDSFLKILKKNYMLGILHVKFLIFVILYYRDSFQLKIDL